MSKKYYLIIEYIPMRKIPDQELLKSESLDNKSHLAIRTQFAIARIQGHYQLQGAIINREATLTAAKIGARARYFHGISALIGAFGVFGGFAFTLYQETREVKNLASKLENEVKSHNQSLVELSESYNRIADLYQLQNQLDEAQVSRNKASIAHEGRTLKP